MVDICPRVLLDVWRRRELLAGRNGRNILDGRRMVSDLAGVVRPVGQ